MSLQTIPHVILVSWLRQRPASPSPHVVLNGASCTHHVILSGASHTYYVILNGTSLRVE